MHLAYISLHGKGTSGCRLFKTWYMGGLGIVKVPETLVLMKRDSEVGKIQRGPKEFKEMDSSAIGVCKTEGRQRKYLR